MGKWAVYRAVRLGPLKTGWEWAGSTQQDPCQHGGIPLPFVVTFPWHSPCVGKNHAKALQTVPWT